MKVFIQTPNSIDHFIQIKLVFDLYTPTKIQLPSWRPGRYELQNFSQYVREIRFFDNETQITAARVNKDIYQFDNITNTLIVEYKYYANQMDAGSSFVDTEQTYINFINCIYQPIGFEEYPIEVTFSDTNYTQFATALKIRGNQLYAENYYELIDSPVIHSNNIQKESYHVDNCTFNIWIQGECTPNWQTLISEFEKFSKEQFDIFGEFPMDEYHFLLQILPYRHYHGVEHAKSTVITLGPDTDFHSKTFWENLLGISSHELFHSWNVCKIKPEEFTPHYDLSKEIYHETGYITEGITTFYGDYTLARSGVFTTEDFFNEINKYFSRHFTNDGRHHSSLTESSYKLWLDGYKNIVPNNKVSIYIKGALAAMILDLQIRRLTDDNSSLDAVMREMYKQFGSGLLGYNHSSYKKVIEQVTSIDTSSYFEQIIFGTTDLFYPLNKEFNHVGLKVNKSTNSVIHESLFGFVMNTDNIITKIEENSPAHSSLDTGDKIILVNDLLPENYIWDENLALCTLDILRLGKNIKITLIPDGKEHLQKYLVEKQTNATKKQKLSFEKWLNKTF